MTLSGGVSCANIPMPRAPWNPYLMPKARDSRIRPKLNLIRPYLKLKAPESSLLLRVQPATSPCTHQLRYHGDLSQNSLRENNLRPALLVSNILFHIHALHQFWVLNFYSLPVENLSKFAMIVNCSYFFAFFTGNAQVMSVCRLEKNVTIWLCLTRTGNYEIKK